MLLSIKYTIQLLYHFMLRIWLPRCTCWRVGVYCLDPCRDPQGQVVLVSSGGRICFPPGLRNWSRAGYFRGPLEKCMPPPLWRSGGEHWPNLESLTIFFYQIISTYYIELNLDKFASFHANRHLNNFEGLSPYNIDIVYSYNYWASCLQIIILKIKIILSIIYDIISNL